MGARERLYDVVFLADTPAGQLFDLALLLCILFSVVLTMLETVRSLNHQYWHWFRTAEVMFTALFAAEYVLRVCISPVPMAYVCSFFGVVDLCAVLPTLVEELFPMGASTLRIVRVLRLLRVFRVMHFAGLEDEASELRAAFWASRRKIVVFLLAIVALVTVMGTVVYVLEDNRTSGFTSIPRSIYWAVVTVTTVGYGDIAPQSVAGQTVASLMMLTGYSLLAVPTGIAAASYGMRSPLSVEVGGFAAARTPGASSAARARRRSRTSSSSCHELEAAAVPQRACSACEAIFHDDDAAFCKMCGTALD